VRVQDPSRQRAWVLAHQDRWDALDREVRDRLAVIHDRLWSPAPPDLFWKIAVPLLAGGVSLQEAVLLLVQACRREGTPPVDLQPLSTMLGLLHGLSYVYRLNHGPVKMVYGASPDRLRTGAVHVLDLSPAQLEDVLGQAVEVHGVAKVRESFERLLTVPGEPLPPPPAGPSHGAVAADHKYFSAAMHLQADLRAGAEIVCRKLRLPPDERKALRATCAMFGEFFGNPHVIEWIIGAVTPWVRSKEGDLEALTELDAERIVSMAKVSRQQAVKVLGDSGLVAMASRATGERGRILQAKVQRAARAIMRGRRPSSLQKPVSPDELYRVHQAHRQLVKEIKAFCKGFANPVVACERFIAAHPDRKVPREFVRRIADDRGVPTGELALRLTADRFNLGRESCRQRLRQGAATAKINAVWAAYLQRPACPLNRPAEMKLSDETRALVEVQAALATAVA
jgi:hypothetical protein